MFILIGCHLASAQQCKISGKIFDQNKKPIKDAFIFSKEDPSIGTVSNAKGQFLVRLESDADSLSFIVSHLGFYTKEQIIGCLSKEAEIILTPSAKELPSVQIDEKKQDKQISMQTIDARKYHELTTASGNFEALLFSRAGVQSRNELSSQFSVRGGNFDENLIYVDDIEIYRPFIVRSGQQEGLSFINPDMVQSVAFSTGGFEAKYGDKMSSVLDVKYKQVDSAMGAVSVSLLGLNAFLGTRSKNYKFRQIHGFRYRTNRYLLGALETSGDYVPNFLDYQTKLTYAFSDKFSIDVLANIATNTFGFKPQTRETNFGSIQQALRLTVFFQGEEKNRFNTTTSALTLNFKPTSHSQIRLIQSVFLSDEREFYDVLGQYRLSELEADLGSDDFGNETFTLGVGSFQNHARNQLNAAVYQTKLLYDVQVGKRSGIQTGLRFQTENINDVFKEWQLLDSSGYSLPFTLDSVGYQNPSLQAYQDFNATSFESSNNTLSNFRIQPFFQYNTLIKIDSNFIKLSAGVRAHYWSYNAQTIFSPRLQLKTIKNKKGMQYKLALGHYAQPAFYRELRDLDGALISDVKAQESFQVVLGVEKDLQIWQRPFILSSEVYYKHQWNLIPYYIDNVRIRYYPKQTAKGRTGGLDMHLFGQFVEGIDSWLSVSYLQTKEDISGDDYYVYYNDNGEIIRPFTNDKVVVDSNLIQPGFIRRPTDQRLSIGLFFQDFIPNNPRYKVHLNMLYGSRIPYGELLFRTRDTLEIAPYRRVDIGFSARLDPKEKKQNGFRVKSTWLTFEVFNLFGIKNTISYQWIKDINNTRWPVPNFLTDRRLNLKLRVEF